jgi:hypothetical protein
MKTAIGAAFFVVLLWSVAADPDSAVSCSEACEKKMESCMRECGEYDARNPTHWATCRVECTKHYEECLEKCKGASKQGCIDVRTGMLKPCP